MAEIDFSKLPDKNEADIDFSKLPDKRDASVPQPQEGGFVQDVSKDLSKRWTNIKKQPLSRPEGVFRDLGQVAGGLGDVVGAGAKTLFTGLTSEGDRQAIGEKFQQFSQTDTGKWFLDKIQQGKKTYDDFKKKHPDITADFEAGLNIASILPMGRAAKAGEEGVVATANTVADITKAALKRTPAQLDKEMAKNVLDRLPAAGIKARGVKSTAQIKAFDDASVKAVKYITENKGELGILNKEGIAIEGHPTDVHEFAEAVQNAKKKIWSEQIQPLLDKVGNPTFSTQPIVEDLEKLIDPTSKRFASLQRHFPDGVKEIERMVDSYKKQGVMKFEQLEPELQDINKKLKALNKGIDSKMAIDDEALLTVAGHLRSIEDKMVMGIQSDSKGIVETKKTWGALKHIEESVAQKANFVAGKKYSQGAFGNGYLGATSTAEMALGIATANPHTIAASVLTRTASYLKNKGKDPNSIVKNMFKASDKTVAKQKVSQYFYNPKSKLFGNTDAQSVTGAIKEGALPTAEAATLQTANPERWKTIGEDNVNQ
jgi:hypothetical protein